ncbi:MAG TPA: endonuclease/exonuclease/phosphatase family protein [Thermoleophilaceae bacterium]
MPTARISALIAALLLVPAATADAKPAKVSVMTRNLYLGADLTPGVNAKNIQELVNGAGVVLNEVDANNFPVRAEGLAQEILTNTPDIVGLQEVALWRSEPCDKSPLPPTATTTRYDYLASLLKELNTPKKLYRVAVVKPEFDFEIWANTDGNEQTSGPGCPFGSEINGRLTMRDAIVVRNGVKTARAKTGTFSTLLQVKPGGVGVNVTRGWTALDATVRGKKFHFVNTHLEAFDSNPSNSTNTNETVGNGEIRAAQAKQLIANGGAARSKLPVILLGDLNSDVRTEVKKGDGLAYRALLDVKFVERSTSNPLGCCLNASVLTTSGGGKPGDFDHKVDHVMTNKPKKVKLMSSKVTGLTPVNGFWDSDHAGILSVLRVS